MRALIVAASAVVCGVAGLTGQQSHWSAALAAGYGQQTGDPLNKSAIWITAAGLLELRPALHGGIELGYHRFGSIVSLIPDAYGPGSLIREDFRRSFWQASATIRVRPSAGQWRPYGGSGLGAYLVHVHDHIVSRDASGNEIPNLGFDQTTTAVKPGAHLLAGLERARLLGRVGLGLQGRWDGILDGGLASILSLGVVVGLD